MIKKFGSVLILFVLTAAMLAGCSAPAVETTQPPVVTTEAPTVDVVQTTEAPVATATIQPTIRSADFSRLVLATTSSTQDSGLLDYLLPFFEEEFNTKVDVIAVGTGQAIQLGKDGNADVLMVHDRPKEDAFMESGDGVRREDLMYNDYVIVGPEADPAGIAGMTVVTEAFAKIAQNEAPFISRGDKSGTHSKELAIWKAAGIEPEGDWYIEAGQTMGAVLTMANELQAYTLSDRATYLARTLEGIDLKILVEGDRLLLNPYGVIAVNPAKGPQINAELSTKFIDWIISVPIQEKIAAFGQDKFGQSLFTPDSAPWRENK